MPRRYIYRFLRASWGIYIDLAAEVVPLAQHNGEAREAAPSLWLAFPPTWQPQSDTVHYLLVGLRLMAPQLGEIIRHEGPLVVRVVGLEFDPVSYQAEGLALAVAGWVAEEYALPFDPPLVAWDRTARRYHFAFPEAALVWPGIPPLDSAMIEHDRRAAAAAPAAFQADQPRPLTPRSAWGLRESPVPPYDLATLRRAAGGDSLLVRDGVASGFMWVARADPKIVTGFAEALSRGRVGRPPDELHAWGQVRLEDAQAFVDGHKPAIGAPLQLHRREQAETRGGRGYVYLTDPGMQEGDTLIIHGEVYDAFVGEHDRLLRLRAADEWARYTAMIVVVRDGTVMANIGPAATTGPSRGLFPQPPFLPFALL